MFKTVWVDSFPLKEQEHLVDGIRFAADTEKALTELDEEGYDVISITPVVSGRYSWVKFDSRTSGMLLKQPTASPDTCASWGYSMTDGVLISARKKRE